MTVLATVDGLDCTYPDGQRIALDARFTVSPGECVLVTGPSGSGKSTLLHVMADCFEGPCSHGPFIAPSPNGDGPLRVGLVPQNPDTQLFCGTVAEEIAFGPKNFGRSKDDIEAVMARLLPDLGIGRLAHKNMDDLSMGERQRVALASVLALEPGLLLLDEPFDQLDDTGKANLRAILEREKRLGLGIVIVEHRTEHLGGLADEIVALPGESAFMPPDMPLPDTSPKQAPPAGPVLEVENLRLQHPGWTVFANVSFSVDHGEKILLVGDNGSGKTTLLSCLTGGLAPTSGSIRFQGEDLPATNKLVGRIGYLMQNPERCIFELTVEDELSFTMRRTGLSPEATRDRAKALAGYLGFPQSLSRSPFQLSFGQKHATALASVSAALPGLLLLDEPMTGLDNTFRHRMLGLLDTLCDRHGMAVLMAAHDTACSGWAHRTLYLRHGEISPDPGEGR
jgi:energy-coupling factor transport system ATP-binding protein